MMVNCSEYVPNQTGVCHGSVMFTNWYTPLIVLIGLVILIMILNYLIPIFENLFARILR